MPRAPAAILALLVLAGCGRAEAPQDVGVCWRMDQTVGQAPTYKRLAGDVQDLDTCAVLLEALRLQGQSRTNGAYQGYFIFVDGAGMSSARHTDGFRYPIFQPPQRAAVDRDLQQLMREHGGRMPNASDLSLERR